MNQDPQLINSIMSNKSVLNVDAQKELINHTIAVSTKTYLKVYFLVFFVTLITIGVIIFGVFYLTGVIG